jgi:glycosyltransferase involved in cell wall biosynthesis
MKVLVNCSLPFALAHGGQAVQIDRTMTALREIGVEIEPMRWWDKDQQADLILYFGRMPADHIRFAQQKGIKVVMAELLTAQGSRSASQLLRQKLISRTIKRFAPRTFTAAFNWDSYKFADAFIALTPWEKHLMEYLFDAAPEKVLVVANGVEEVFFASSPRERGPWLVCTATITERKRVLELAEAAVAARTPVWIIGSAYAASDSYARNFFALAKENPKTIRYEGPVNDRSQLASIYRSARGFVLLSNMESLSLSALEAAACGCPLLLSDLPWARSTFAEAAAYAPIGGSAASTAVVLKNFYDKALRLPAPAIKLYRWHEVAQEMKKVFDKVLAQNHACQPLRMNVL